MSTAQPLVGLACAWLGANCPSLRVQADLGRQVEAAVRYRLDCHLLIGPRLTTCGRPFLVHCFAGEFFVFALTAGQFDRFGVSPTGMRFTVSREPFVRPVAPPISLSDLVVESTDRLDVGASIRGTCCFQSPGWTGGPCALRIDYQPAQGRPTAAWDYDCIPLGWEGSLSFEFPPCRQPVTAPMAVFLRVVEPPQGARDECVPLSNCCAVLMEGRTDSTSKD